MTAGPRGGNRTCLHIKGQLLSVTPAPNRLDTCLSMDFTDGLTMDWGGKPFIDLQRGWKYAIDSIRRSTLIVWSQHAPAGAVTL
ncbi:hypothetical protein BJV78DRAFT_1202436 [Lactifluus subvellereus]|nr:hypothetical protein BJV78DRAFT_1202436 [Lactifluus subvellereus]